MKFKLYLTILISLYYALALYSQGANKVYVDESGVMRWTADNSDVALFGVNYDVPFAHSYRSIKKLGLSHKDAIDMDVNQFARLELDAYRIHIWDREISDKQGNLDENEHLELLDYLIQKLKEKNISILLTPIAWWGTGWPEPDPETKGFSTFYSKVELVTNAEAREAQRNYIRQILNHVNKYTGLSYKGDPDIIAFEVINEPGHPDNIEETTGYINEMASVFRNEGVTKPIYYNISQNWSGTQAMAVYDADIDGISFQWYPTGLVKYSALKGNYLPHVDHYPIPEIDNPKFKNKTRMVYEFDAADVARPIMYPAMARSFREAGMQWATQFAYDATFLAAFNTDYNTHYVNLLYTPAKAISLMIAANVFRSAKLFQSFGSYPRNKEFAGCSIDYETNLSTFIGNQRFYYTGNTSRNPEDISSLEHIAGCGSSPLIKYNGTGSYFFDKLSDGIWRAEINPDAIEMKDPFGRNSLSRKVTTLLFNKSDFEINLADLGADFYVYSLSNETPLMRAQDANVALEPGIYILARNEVDNHNEVDFNFRGLGLKAHSVPQDDFSNDVVRNRTPESIFGGNEPVFSVDVYSRNIIDSVKIYAKRAGWRGFASANLTKAGKYRFMGRLERFNSAPGLVEYCYEIFSGKDSYVYPGNINNSPNAWNFEQSDLYQLNIIPGENDYILFQPEKNFSDIILPPIWGTARLSFDVVNNDNNLPVINFGLTNFRRHIDSFTFQIDAGIDLTINNIDQTKGIELELYNPDGIDSVYLTVVDFNCNSKGTWIRVNPETENYIVSPDQLEETDFMLLPRPYPHFLPLNFETSELSGSNNLMSVSYFQISIPIHEQNLKDIKLGLQLGRIKIAR